MILSEELKDKGYEFINEVWTPSTDWEILTESNNAEKLTSEQKKLIAEGKILGVVRGEYFFPDGVSRNVDPKTGKPRRYKLSFWEKQLKKSQEMINEGLMVGMVGHEETPIKDTDLRQGLTSHKINRLWIDKSSGKPRGMGEAYILTTEGGRNLKSHLDAGVKLRVSSRGAGKLIESKEFMDVDEDNYYLDTFDFVRKAGFHNALPEILQEGLNNYLKGDFMPNDNRDIQVLSESLDKTQSSLNNALLENVDLKNENNNLINENVRLSEALERLQIFEGVDESVSEALMEIKESGLMPYLKYFPSLLEMVTDDDGNVMSPDKATEVLESLKEKLVAYQEIDPDPDAIVETLETQSQIIDSYYDFGTPEQLSEHFEVSESLFDIVNEKHQSDIDNKIKVYSESYNLEMELVHSILEKHDEDEAVEIFEKMASGRRNKFVNEGFTSINEGYEGGLHKNHPSVVFGRTAFDKIADAHRPKKAIKSIFKR